MSSTTSKELFALVDCNNFYVSCERVFNPALRNIAVVVLSNNDGCAIARSKEAKALGISMGTPASEILDLIKRGKVIACSSNYALYGDMSRRIMQTLGDFFSTIQVYSIDEAFVLLPPLGAEEAAILARKTVLQHVGVPVSIGVSHTKTLAKIANSIAKNSPEGVFLMSEASVQEAILKDCAVEEIWGIGHQISQFLYSQGIKTAWQLKDADDAWIRKHLSVVALRTVWELRGISCLKLEEAIAPKKSIVCSKSFGRPVRLWEELAEAISSYTARAAEKLRRQKSKCSALVVFIESKREYEKGIYTNQLYLTLPQPTAYTPFLIQNAKWMLKRLFREGLAYKKAGVMLDGLVDASCFQMDMFSEKNNLQKQEALMKIIDMANKDLGRRAIRFAAEGLVQPWKMRQASRSPRYTTRWNELLICK